MQVEVEPCKQSPERTSYWAVSVNGRETARCHERGDADLMAKLMTVYYASWSYVWLFSLTRVRHAFRARAARSVCGTFDRKFARVAVSKPLNDCRHCKRIVEREMNDAG